MSSYETYKIILGKIETMVSYNRITKFILFLTSALNPFSTSFDLRIPAMHRPAKQVNVWTTILSRCSIWGNVSQNGAQHHPQHVPDQNEMGMYPLVNVYIVMEYHHVVASWINELCKYDQWPSSIANSECSPEGNHYWLPLITSNHH